jgi:hypothetical protein
MSARSFTHTATGVGYPAPRARTHARLIPRGVEARKIAQRAAGAALLGAMAAGSLALWTIVPAGVLWLVSRLGASSGAMSAGIFLAVALEITAAVALGAQALLRLERVYMRLTSATPSARVVPGWRRSLSDSNALAPASVLEKMMVASVLLAVVALVIWFFAFAGSSGPA